MRWIIARLVAMVESLFHSTGCAIENEGEVDEQNRIRKDGRRLHQKRQGTKNHP